MVVLLLPEETQPDGQLEGRHPHGGRGARVERLQVARRRRHARTAGGEGRQLNSSLTSPIFMLKFLVIWSLLKLCQTLYVSPGITALLPSFERAGLLI